VHSSDRLVALTRIKFSPGRSLSPREKECLELASRGLQNVEIAKVAGISTNTLKYHLKNAYDKLGVTNRTEAVAEAIRRGFING